MASSNADSPDIDASEFTDHYGYGPQEFVNRVAVGQLHAQRLATEEKALAEAKAALVPGGWEKLTDQRAMQDGADAENLYLSQVEVVDGIKHQQAQAKAFAAEKIDFGAYRSYLGKTANQLIDNDLIDGDEVRAALVAAQG